MSGGKAVANVRNGSDADRPLRVESGRPQMASAKLFNGIRQILRLLSIRANVIVDGHMVSER